MVYEPAPLPGPPGICTFEIPRHPHELNISATTSSATACQTRCRARHITCFTGPLPTARAPQRALGPASAGLGPGSRLVLAGAVVSAPGGSADQCTAAGRVPRCMHSAGPVGSADLIEPVAYSAHP